MTRPTVIATGDNAVAVGTVINIGDGATLIHANGDLTINEHD